MVKSPAGSRYVRNLTYEKKKKRTSLAPDLKVLRNLDIVQIEIVRCQKGQYVYKDQRTKSSEKRIHGTTVLLWNSLPNDKILDWSNLKGVADDKINVLEKLKFV